MECDICHRQSDHLRSSASGQSRRTDSKRDLKAQVEAVNSPFMSVESRRYSCRAIWRRKSRITGCRSYFSLTKGWRRLGRASCAIHARPFIYGDSSPMPAVCASDSYVGMKIAPYPLCLGIRFYARPVFCKLSFIVTQNDSRDGTEYEALSDQLPLGSQCNVLRRVGLRNKPAPERSSDAQATYAREAY